jgi:preprotein translocase SecE subunit
LLTKSNMNHFINYLKDTFAELSHVSWPTQRQSIVYTVLVVIVSALVALYVGLFDFVFSKGLDWFVK